MSNISNQKSSLCPANGRQTVGDGAASFDIKPSVLAVCQVQGADDMYYYSTTFSGGPGPVSVPHHILRTGSASSDSSTPPLTPDDGSDCSSIGVGSPEIGPQHPKDALEFLMTVFPRHGLTAMPYAKNVSISAQTLGSSFEGMVLDLPGQTKTLYVDAKNAESVSLRESIVALLDLADELLDCSALVIVLERSSPVLGEVLHSLMYVGGTVVTKPPFPVDPAFVLVGMEI
ncbi:hypothetical protein V5O48_006465 [Marasmius crinis-equi]|uniref:Ornithine decarboxylase antizyme n=1 Tax=Marasmius crinis-equi TaxID=585013 RepID=A0ABR3FJM8_9AGAR